MMDLLRKISLAWSLFYALIVFLVLFESRYPKKKTAVCLVLFTAPLFALNLGVMFLSGPDALSRVMLLTLSLPSLILFYVLDKRRGFRFLFTFCFADTISYEIILLTSLLDFAVGGGKHVLALVLRLILFPLTTYLLYKKWRDPYLAMQKNVSGGWGSFALMSAVFYLLLVFGSSYPVVLTERPEDIPVFALVMLLMPLTYLTIFRLLIRQRELYVAQFYERNARRQSELMEAELSAQQEFVLQARRHRHDIRHGIRVTMEYLNRNDVQGAKDFMKEYETSLSEGTLPSFCENKTVNALFSFHARRCESLGVPFTFEGEIPDPLPYTAVEAGTLFGNLTENACEAAEQCEAPFVQITAQVREGTLYVQIRNRVSGTVVFDGDFPVTTKKRGGIGMRSVARILKQYGGMMQLEQKDTTFVTRIIQPLGKDVLSET